jgi:hypothetical protein
MATGGMTGGLRSCLSGPQSHMTRSCFRQRKSLNHSFPRTLRLRTNEARQHKANHTTRLTLNPNKWAEGVSTAGPSGSCISVGCALHELFRDYSCSYPSVHGNLVLMVPTPMASSSFSAYTPANTTIHAQQQQPDQTQARSTHRGFSANPPPPRAGPRSAGGSAPDLVADGEPRQPPVSGDTAHGARSPSAPTHTHHQQGAGEDDTTGPHTADTPSSTDAGPSVKKRKTARGSRGVANLTPEQLARKRANGKWGTHSESRVRPRVRDPDGTGRDGVEGFPAAGQMWG